MFHRGWDRFGNFEKAQSEKLRTVMRKLAVIDRGVTTLTRMRTELRGNISTKYIHKQMKGSVN
jgi:hypothetical protein